MAHETASFFNEGSMVVSFPFFPESSTRKSWYDRLCRVMKFSASFLARFHSTRFPGKVLARPSLLR